MTTADLDTGQMLQAGEYVLGTLDDEARARFRARLPESTDLQRAVREWQRRLQPLAETTPRVMPSSAVWRRVTTRLDLDRRSPFADRTREPATESRTTTERRSAPDSRSVELASSATDDDLAAFLADAPPKRAPDRRGSRPADDSRAEADGWSGAEPFRPRADRAERRTRNERSGVEAPVEHAPDTADETASSGRLVRRLRRSRQRWRLGTVALGVLACALVALHATRGPAQPPRVDWLRPAVLGVVTDGDSSALWSVELATRPAQARIVPLAEPEGAAESYQLWLLGSGNAVLGTLGLLPSAPGTVSIDPIAPDLAAQLDDATALGVSREPTLGSPDPTSPSGALVYRAPLTRTAQSAADAASGV